MYFTRSDERASPLRRHLPRNISLAAIFERVDEPKSDKDILTWSSKTYGKRMVDKFKTTLGFEPTNQYSNIPPGYKPELDINDLCNGY